MMTEYFTQRREKRESFYITVDCAVCSAEEYAKKIKTFKAITTNLSNSGLGIYTDRPLEQGASMALFSNRLGVAPLTALVKWCQPASRRGYKVGLELA